MRKRLQKLRSQSLKEMAREYAWLSRVSIEISHRICHNRIEIVNKVKNRSVRPRTDRFFKA